MEAIITAVGAIVTGSVSWIGSFVTTITAQPLLLFFVLMSAAGLGVGLIRRIIRL